MKVCFSNEGHIGDLLLNLPFIDLLIKKYPENEYYQYNRGTVTIFDETLIRSVPGLIETNEVCGDINIFTWMCNEEYKDWVASDDYSFVDHFTVQKFYWEKIYEKHGFDVEIPDDLGINHNFVITQESKDKIETFSTRKTGKILIFNQKTRSGQADNQDYMSYLVRMANIFPQHDFLYTNEEDIDDNLILYDNLFYTPSIFGELRCDIMQNSYISLFCDIILGRANGPFMFAAMHNSNVLNKNKLIIGQHNGNHHKDDLEINFNRSIYKARNIHTKTSRETFGVLESVL